jgi:hypothetical protein
MSETHEAAGQHMQEEAADKFVRVERYSLDTIALTTITIGKADAPITHVEDPMVGNGDAMGIAADIVQDVCRTCQRSLGVDDPVFKQHLLSLRRNLRPVKPIYWSLLMRHEHAARALIELLQIGKTSPSVDPVLQHAPEAFNGIEVVAATGWQ